MPENSTLLHSSQATAERALDFVLRAGRAAPDQPGRGEVLEVAQVWNDVVLDVQHYAPRDRPLTLGSRLVRRLPWGALRPADDLCVPNDELPHPGFPLVTWVLGNPVCRLDPGWDGGIERVGRRIPLQELRAAGELLAEPDGSPRLVLRIGEPLVIRVGLFTFVLQRIHAVRRVWTPFAAGLDVPLLVLVASFGLLSIMFGVLLASTPMSVEGEIRALPERYADLFLQTPDPPAVEEPQARQDEGARAKREEGRRGRRDAQLKDAKGEAQDLDRRQADKELAESAGLTGALREGSELDELLGGNSLDEGLLGGIGGLIGPRGVAQGSHGLGGRGIGLGGGGNSRGLGGIGTHGRGGGEKEYGQGHGDGTLIEKPVSSTGPLGIEPIILGQMDRAVIDAVIRAHLDQIRYCYQRELQKEPGLVGKVTVRFVIAGDGTVSQSETKASTLANPAVESCIHGRFLRFEFPAPKRNGIVIVTYPFLFAPG